MTDVPPATALPHSLSAHLLASPRKATQLQVHHRWQIDENFQAGRGLTDLEEHQVRSVTAIRRHQTLVNCASCLRWDALFHDHPTLHETRKPRP